MSVYYNSKRLIPAPLVSFDKVYQRTGDGQTVGCTYAVKLTGTLACDKGSPTSSGTFWATSGYPGDETLTQTAKHTAILRKQEALRGLFADDGKLFEIRPLDESTPLKCYPRKANISFAEGVWVDRCEYSIEFEADQLDGLIYSSGEDIFPQFISDANEAWNLEFADTAENENQPAVFRLTHSVSAVGKRHYTSAGTGSVIEPWVQARSWVQPLLGIDANRILASGSLNLPAYMQGLNHVRNESVDKRAGSYGVTETWLIASGSALEDFTVTTQVGSEDGLDHVSIQGTITGLETRNGQFQVTTTKYSSANTKYIAVSGQLHSRAQTYSGLSLNSESISRNISRNPVAGNIQYSYDFNNRPTKAIPGSKSEVITIQYDDPEDIFASIAVLGRKRGPLLQDIGASGDARKSLSIEIVMPPASGLPSTWEAQAPSVTGLIATFRPTGYTQVFISQKPNKTWNPMTGRFSYNIQWVYQ